MKERSKENATLPLPSGSREYVGKRIQLRTILKLALLGIIVYTTIFKSVLLRIDSRLAIHRTGRTNVIFMISDGYGPASASLGRSFLQVVQNSTDANAKYMTPLDHILVGTHRSRSSNSLVTDSAAGATAFACGLKTNNYAIGVDERGASCGTVLEGAKSKGFLTGIVVTTRITDATPGSYFAHVPSRGLEPEIANEVFGYDGKGKKYRETPLDLAFGGGGCFFLPQAHPLSCRQDDHDLLQVAREQGWNIDILFDTERNQSTENPMENAIVSSSHALPFSPAHSFSTTINLTQVDSFWKNKTPLPHLSLLTPSNTPFVIDRPDSIPGLPDLAVKALNALDSSSKNKKGFFIMIEGSQIDLCSHLNDPACHAREIEEYQKTIDRVLDWVESSNKRGDRTLLVSTSDHETGGLALARQLTSEPYYGWHPEHLVSVKRSALALGSDLAVQKQILDEQQLKRYVRSETLGPLGAGFAKNTGGDPTNEEIDSVVKCLGFEGSMPSIADSCRIAIADVISKRALTAWSTSGHSAVDVNVYAAGIDSHLFAGNHENTDLGHLVARYLNVDLSKTTKHLRQSRNESL